MPEGLPHSIHFRVPTDLTFVRPVRKMLEGLLEALGWEEDDIEDAALIVTEVVQNAIEHGSRADGREWVELSCHVQELALELEVGDPGTGKDPREVLERDVEAPVPLDAARGRGLFLIGRLSGAFERRLSAQGGLSIRVRKEVSGS